MGWVLEHSPLGLPVISGQSVGGLCRPDRHRVPLSRDAECHKTETAQFPRVRGERLGSATCLAARPAAPAALGSSWSRPGRLSRESASSPGWLASRQQSNCRNPGLASSRGTAMPRAASKHLASPSDETRVTCLPPSRQLCPAPSG